MKKHLRFSSRLIGEVYYCFGCGAKGDIFSSWKNSKDWIFAELLKLLADRAGVVLENYNPKEEGEKERLYRIMEEATKFFEIIY